MARMTLGQAEAKARELAASVQRLTDLHNGEGEGARGTAMPPRSLTRWRQNRSGRDHELQHLRNLTTDLVAGLAGIGPTRNGQIGGQHQGGHDTSATALQLVAPKAGSQRERVLQALAHNGLPHGDDRERQGLTDVQLATSTGLPANSLRPRRVELVDAGWVEDSGRRREHNGRPHVVWVLTDAAHEQLRTERMTT